MNRPKVMNALKPEKPLRKLNAAFHAAKEDAHNPKA